MKLLQGPPRPYNRRYWLDYKDAGPTLPGDDVDCAECFHWLGEHDNYGHCQDECSCGPDMTSCPCGTCRDFGAAGREWEAAKAHDEESCCCDVCEFKRRRALEAL